MSHSVLIESIQLVSFFASVAGLFVLCNDRSTQADFKESNWMLMAMTFGYWMIHCVARIGDSCLCEDWTVAVMSVKMTALFSMLLTFSCALSLPLNLIAAKNPQEDP
jgi:hypothetical protein